MKTYTCTPRNVSYLHPDCGSRCPLEEAEGAVLRKRVGLAVGAVCCLHEEALSPLCSEEAGPQGTSRSRFLVVQQAVEVGGDLNTRTQIIKQSQRYKTQ